MINFSKFININGKAVIIFIMALMCFLISLNIENKNANAFLVNICPLDGNTLTFHFEGDTYESEVIDCSDQYSSICNLQLNWYRNISGDVYEHIQTQFRCSENGIFIEDYRCFFTDTGMICPLLSETDMVSFEDGDVTYKYPESLTPMLQVYYHY